MIHSIFLFAVSLFTGLLSKPAHAEVLDKVPHVTDFVYLYGGYAVVWGLAAYKIRHRRTLVAGAMPGALLLLGLASALMDPDWLHALVAEASLAWWLGAAAPVAMVVMVVGYSVRKAWR